MYSEEDHPLPVEIALDRIAEQWEDQHARPRGIFTDTDRQFLWGLKEYSHDQTVINRRQDIRERVINGIRDLGLLLHLSDRDRATIFDSLDRDELHEDVATFLAFIYERLDADEDALRHIIESAIYKHERTFGAKNQYQGGVEEVTVNIQIDRGPNVDELESRLRDGDPQALTPKEIGVLVRAGRLEPEDLSPLQDKDAESLDHPQQQVLAHAEESGDQEE